MAHLVQTIAEFGLEPTVALLNRGFADYFVPIKLDISSFLRLMVMDQVDPERSKVVMKDGEALGLALIARRGWTSRLATMAIVPEGRGMGVGSWLMKFLIEEARDRGERHMVLEVIHQNEPAVRLYRKFGFDPIRRLFGYQLDDPPVKRMDKEFEEIDYRQLARAVTQHGYPDLPWQLSGESQAPLGPPNLAFRLEGAYAATTNPESQHVYLRSLVVDPAERGQGKARQLLQVLFNLYPSKTWHIPAIFPEEMDPLFSSVGFEREELSQLQMRLGLEG